MPEYQDVMFQTLVPTRVSTAPHGVQPFVLHSPREASRAREPIPLAASPSSRPARLAEGEGLHCLCQVLP